MLKPLLLAALLATPALAETPTVPVIRVHDEKRADVSPLLFGQFLEIASWGERGPEAYADPETGELPAAVVEKLRELHAPLIRFPFGSDSRFLDWTDRVAMPGRPAPVSLERGEGGLTNRFTYDHFLRLCEELDAEPLLVVKSWDAVFEGGDAVAADAQQAANLVAYTNAEVDAALPPAQLALAALRAANGRIQPYGVKKWQVGNELFFGLNDRGDRDFYWTADPEEELEALADAIVTRYTAVADAMLAVDPTLQLVAEGEWRSERGRELILGDPRMKERFAYVTNHAYGPWKTNRLRRGGELINASTLDEQTLTAFGAFYPRGLDAEGRSRGLDDWAIEAAEAHGYRAVATEWNWNGWGDFDLTHPTVAAHARALGTAGYLNGMLRQAEHVAFATQSMMLAESWNIGGVQGDPAEPGSVFLGPSGAATALYAELHGPELREVTLEGMPEPLRVDLTRAGGVIGPQIPVVDATATAGPGVVYVHAVQRRFDAELAVEIRVAGLDPGLVAAVAVHSLVREADHERPFASTVRRSVEVDAAGREAIAVTLPAASVSVVEIRHGG
ncbi:hypothetical protein [Phycisphaera mikurensis]|uniref:non-reducing end alpha-L-arabinofuranosidase n=1 Tax=Phycisphaera mikurensis (strain NBRC 102666 / KCTC 22515 / FYK2301M01) TaxID=1142394 RepID=I0IDK5_PHYMF|nr:hypothetical protein [Phycisphaera mikurensis]MBB6441163.1 alpha-N-arabinofuranosidase [Phycisphaera mikurensis]BAM03343.1 hypothetical protein PSMK_11840 [Phycisphaera mikurensis NBRC 102666]